MKRFSKKVVLVTGSSRGIGRSIAIEFAREGASIILNFKSSAEEAREVVAEIEALGSPVLALQADIAEESEVSQLVKKSLNFFGTIDILINNAGSVDQTPLLNKTSQIWQKTLGVNLIGAFLCIKYCVETMHRQGGGVIINISSTSGIDVLCDDIADYDASKSALISLTKNFATNLAKSNIRVNAVAPGWVNTAMNRDLSENFIKTEINRISLERFADPIEIAKPVLFLASADASYINGSVLVVDGGYR